MPQVSIDTYSRMGHKMFDIKLGNTKIRTFSDREYGEGRANEFAGEIAKELGQKEILVNEIVRQNRTAKINVGEIKEVPKRVRNRTLHGAALKRHQQKLQREAGNKASDGNKRTATG